MSQNVPEAKLIEPNPKTSRRSLNCPYIHPTDIAVYATLS